MANMSDLEGTSPLPEYTLNPLPHLLAPIPDKLLTLLLPIVAYWGVSMLFHWIDVNDYYSKYRLHTPAEVLKRNHVSRRDVVRDVVIQQIIQTAVGWVLGMTEPDDFFGKEEYDIALWAQWIRRAQVVVPPLLALFSINAGGLAHNLESSHPMLAGAVSGGRYSGLSVAGNGQLSASFFASWEILLARAIYWYIVPALQFAAAIVVVDTWQYFLHRAMHMNKWLYTSFHSRHHRLYVPYAFGALYNHPFEGFLLDTLGASIAFKIAGLSTRQGMWFFTCSTIKTVDDHCGYALPWDPLQHITSNNAGYHDIHHQSWGIKVNFSQPFFTFWDQLLGTAWTGGDVSARYERSRVAAQKKVDSEAAKSVKVNSSSDHGSYPGAIKNVVNLRTTPLELQKPSILAGEADQQAASSRDQVFEDITNGGHQVLAEEVRVEKEARSMVRKSHRRRTASSITQSESLRGLRERVTMHGRTGAILGVDSGR